RTSSNSTGSTYRWSRPSASSLRTWASWTPPATRSKKPSRPPRPANSRPSCCGSGSCARSRSYARRSSRPSAAARCPNCSPRPSLSASANERTRRPRASDFTRRLAGLAPSTRGAEPETPFPIRRALPMVGSMADGEKRDEERERYERGLPDYHDPTSGWGGAAPARSALTLRLVLAIFGFVLAVGFTIWALLIDAPTLYKILPAVVAVIAAINITAVARRKARGEPG